MLGFRKWIVETQEKHEKTLFIASTVRENGELYKEIRIIVHRACSLVLSRKL